MRLTSGGNLGIGGTDIEAPLHVIAENSHGVNAIFGAKDFIDSASYNYDDANIALQGRDTGNNDTGAGIQFTVRNSGNTNWLHGYAVMPQDGSFAVGTGGAGTTAATERLRIDSSGNVGIGTSSPDAMLHLETANSPRLRLEDTTNSVKTDIFVGNTSSLIGNQSNHNLGFMTNDSERMTITAAGSVGIGTATTDGALTIYNSSVPRIAMGYSSTQDHYISWDSSKLHLQADPGNANGSSAMQFSVDGSEAMRIQPDGMTCVGTTLTTGLAVQGSETGVQFTQNGRIFLATDNHSDFNKFNTGELLDSDEIKHRLEAFMCLLAQHHTTHLLTTA